VVERRQSPVGRLDDDAVGPRVDLENLVRVSFHARRLVVRIRAGQPHALCQRSALDPGIAFSPDHSGSQSGMVGFDLYAARGMRHIAENARADAGMATTAHERALRTIVVSGRSALRKTADPRQREVVMDRVHDLLAELESQVIHDGGDERMLTTLERKRRQLWQ
jgi:hypothetical protein